MPSSLGLAASPESAAEALFCALYEQHFRAIHRYIERLSGDRVLAEDLAQEVFVRLWRELVAVGVPPNSRAWLFHVASNLVVSGFRVKARALRFLRPFAEIAQRRARTVNVEREASHRQVVERVLAQLPDLMRQSLLLHHEGLTSQEIGDVLQVSPTYVRTLVFRSHERFRRACDALGASNGLLR